MATIRKFECLNCNSEVKESPYLFENLLQIAENKQTCKICGGKLSFQITFKLGLDLGETRYNILDVFCPENAEDLSWKDNKDSDVNYYPFLVVMSNVVNDEQAVWLPYWHEVITIKNKTLYKYGQWSPILDVVTFKSLIKQAKKKGYTIY